MRKKILFINAIAVIIIVALALKESNRSLEISSNEALKSLPYLTWVPEEEAIGKVGVVKYDQKKSFKGINLYTPAGLSTAYLIDMYGDILHTWSVKVNGDNTWHHVEMCKNGDLLAITPDESLIRVDWDSNIKWIKKCVFTTILPLPKMGTSMF